MNEGFPAIVTGFNMLCMKLCDTYLFAYYFWPKWCESAFCCSLDILIFTVQNSFNSIWQFWFFLFKISSTLIWIAMHQSSCLVSPYRFKAFSIKQILNYSFKNKNYSNFALIEGSQVICLLMQKMLQWWPDIGCQPVFGQFCPFTP